MQFCETSLTMTDARFTGFGIVSRSTICMYILLLSTEVQMDLGGN